MSNPHHGMVRLIVLGLVVTLLVGLTGAPSSAALSRWDTIGVGKAWGGWIDGDYEASTPQLEPAGSEAAQSRFEFTPFPEAMIGLTTTARDPRQIRVVVDIPNSSHPEAAEALTVTGSVAIVCYRPDWSEYDVIVEILDREPLPYRHTVYRKADDGPCARATITLEAGSGAPPSFVYQLRARIKVRYTDTT